MFKNWGTWLGVENDKGQVKHEGESAVDINEDQNREINKPTAGAESERSSAAEEDAQPPQLLQKAKGFSGESEKSWLKVKLCSTRSCDIRLCCSCVTSVMSVLLASSQVTFTISPAAPQRNCPSPWLKQHKPSRGVWRRGR